ncbi:hypothetical protein RND81_10G083800 [Saponaria officinalis]|uniref:Uncharacterized protein n=1 Tax=Saponaria officinalis TaxID=3572 RepID=A0AAW1HZP8_SAPOF
MEEIFTFFRKRTLVSTKAVEPPCKIHKLSTLDLIMQKHHVNIIIYYNTPLLGSQLGETTLKIRECLTETLSYYHVVSGRLMKKDNSYDNDNDNDNENDNEKGKWVIKCNDAGIRMIEARVKGSVENWLENLDDVNENMLLHWEDMSHVAYNLWPTFYVKVTEFEEGGLALGLSCAHMLADPLSATIFMKALTDSFLCGKTTIPPFFHPLPQRRLGFKNSHHRPNNYLINAYKSLLQSPSPSPLMAQSYTTIALEFKDHIVQSCIRSARLDGLTRSTCSRAFIALVGLIWNCVSRVKEVRHGLVDMSICLNVRKVLGLNQGYFGNCMIYNKVDGDGVRMDDLVSSTRAVETAVENMTKDEIFGLIEWLDNYDNDLSPQPVVSSDNLVFINLEDTDPYSSTIIEGYGPIRVSYYIESIVGKEKVLILPSRPNEGQLSRVVMVTLSSDQALKLCDDNYLARFSPVVIMGPKHR